MTWAFLSPKRDEASVRAWVSLLFLAMLSPGRNASAWSSEREDSTVWLDLYSIFKGAGVLGKVRSLISHPTYAIYFVLNTLCYVLNAIYFMPNTLCYILYAIYFMLYTLCYILHAKYFIPYTSSCYILNIYAEW